MSRFYLQRSKDLADTLINNIILIIRKLMKLSKMLASICMNNILAIRKNKSLVRINLLVFFE